MSFQNRFVLTLFLLSIAPQFVDTATNFREDVTVSGDINSTDVSTVKAASGSALP